MFEGTLHATPHLSSSTWSRVLRFIELRRVQILCSQLPRKKLRILCIAQVRCMLDIAESFLIDPLVNLQVLLYIKNIPIVKDIGINLAFIAYV